MAETQNTLLDRLLASPRHKAGARPPNLIIRVRKGLSARAFTVLCEVFEVPKERMSRVVQIPVRTLARRTTFKPEESERILRLGRLFQQAVGVFGTAERARAWLLEPRAYFGGEAGLDYADTEPGGREVEAVLGRLEHGVFA